MPIDEEVWQELRNADIENGEPPDTPPQDQGNTSGDPRDNKTPAGLAKVFHDF